MKKPSFAAGRPGQNATFSRVLRLTAPSRVYIP